MLIEYNSHPANKTVFRYDRCGCDPDNVDCSITKLNCAYDGPAKTITSEQEELIKELCPHIYEVNTQKTQWGFHKSLPKAKALVGNCEAKGIEMIGMISPHIYDIFTNPDDIRLISLRLATAKDFVKQLWGQMIWL